MNLLLADDILHLVDNSFTFILTIANNINNNDGSNVSNNINTHNSNNNMGNNKNNDIIDSKNNIDLIGSTEQNESTNLCKSEYNMITNSDVIKHYLYTCTGCNTGFFN